MPGSAPPGRVKLPVPNDRALAVGQAHSLAGDGLAVIESVEDMGGVLSCMAFQEGEVWTAPETSSGWTGSNPRELPLPPASDLDSSTNAEPRPELTSSSSVRQVRPFRSCSVTVWAGPASPS